MLQEPGWGGWGFCEASGRSVYKGQETWFDIGFFYTKKLGRMDDWAARGPMAWGLLNELSPEGREAGKADQSFSITEDSGA